MFGELIKSYTENLEPDPYAPRQQPTSVLTAMLRLLGGLLPEVSAKIKYGLPFKEASSCLEAAILFSVVWAFEPSLPAKARAFFNILVRQGENPVRTDASSHWGKNKLAPRKDQAPYLVHRLCWHAPHALSSRSA